MWSVAMQPGVYSPRVGPKGPVLGKFPQDQNIYIYICILYNSFVMTIHIVAEMVYSGTLSTVI